MDNIPTPIAAILVLIGGVYLVWKCIIEPGFNRDKAVSDSEDHS